MKLYPKTKNLLKQANIEILKIKYINNKAIAIIKTFWLKVFQRKIKFYLLKIKYGNFNPVARLEVSTASGTKKPCARATLGSGIRK